MVQELTEYWEQTEKIKRAAELLAAGLTHEQFNWSPGPGRWSIAQSFVHLNLTAQFYFTGVDGAIRRAREKQVFGEGPFRLGLVGGWVIGIVEPPIKTKVRAPKVLIPAPDQSVQDVLPQFMATQDQIIERLRQCDGIHLRRVKMPSPFAKWIRMSLLTGFGILLAHERRHLWQSHEIRKMPDFPNSEKAPDPVQA